MKKLLLLAVLSLHFYASALSYCSNENIKSQNFLTEDLEFKTKYLSDDLTEICFFRVSTDNCNVIDIYKDNYSDFKEREAIVSQSLNEVIGDWRKIYDDCNKDKSPLVSEAAIGHNKIVKLINLMKDENSVYNGLKTRCVVQISKLENLCK